MLNFGASRASEASVHYHFTSSIETKQAAYPSAEELDTNYQSEGIMDASGYTGEVAPPNYRYFSEPVSGLTLLIDASKFDVAPINIRSLMKLPGPDKLKVLALHITPKDGSNAFFEILIHNKSGTTDRDQTARDQESKLFADIAAKLHEIYPNTQWGRFQGDINIPVFIPQDPNNTSIEYLTNNANYLVNESGLSNLLERITPPGAVLTSLNTAAIGVAERAPNLLDNGQSWKLGGKDPKAKSISITFDFLPVSLEPEAITAQNQALIKKISIPTAAITQFAVNSFDSDHRPTAIEKRNNHSTITFPLINTFGSQGFRPESELILPFNMNPMDRARREILKDEWTEQVFNIVIQELHQKNINITEITQGASLIDAAKFVQKNEWVLMNEITLRRILTKIANLKQSKELNAHCHQAKAILNTEAKINDVLKRIFNKNYKISILEGPYNARDGVAEPDKDELINIIKINNQQVAYALKNYTTDTQNPSQVYQGIIPYMLAGEHALTEEQEEELKKRIIQDVNQQHPVATGSRPTAVKGSQILNNLSDGCDWQNNAGYRSGKTNWDPVKEQHQSIYDLVRQFGVEIIALTECSSQKHLNPKKNHQRKDAELRDKTKYTDGWHARMIAFTDKLNRAATLYATGGNTAYTSILVATSGAPVSAALAASAATTSGVPILSFKKTATLVSHNSSVTLGAQQNKTDRETQSGPPPAYTSYVAPNPGASYGNGRKGPQN